MIECGRCLDTGIVCHSKTVLCYCKAGRARRAEAQWIDTMHAVVNDAYSQFDEGEITQEKAAAIIREAIASDPTSKG